MNFIQQCRVNHLACSCSPRKTLFWGTLGDNWLGRMPAFVVDANYLRETKVNSPASQNRSENAQEDPEKYSPYVDAVPAQFQAQAAHRRRATSTRRSLFLLLAAALLPILTALILFSVCNVTRNSKREASGMRHRKLAEGGDSIDENDLYIVEECLALEEEMGILPQEPSPPSTSDRPTRIAELVALFSDSAATLESMPTEQTAWGLHAAPQPDNLNAHALTFADYPFPTIPSAREFSMPPRIRTVEQNNSNGVASDFDPGNWTRIISIIGSRPELHTQGTPSSSSSAEASSEHATRLQQPSSRPSDAAQLPAHDLREHPFVRLPALKSKVVPRRLFPEGVLCPIQMSTSSHSQFSILRRLLIKESLNQDEADELADAVEVLTIKTAKRARRSIRQSRPLFAASTLGTYFLVFDYLLRAAEVFGEPVQGSPWWEEFVQVFDFDYIFPLPRSTCRESAQFNTELANSLLAALRIYKTGCRPPPAFVISLQRKMLFVKASPHRFREPQWDPWREDDKEFWGGKSPPL